MGDRTKDQEKNISPVWILFLILWATGCSVKKYIPEDEFLYSGADLNLHWEETPKDKKLKREELEGVLYPKPNSKILGMKPGLYFYYRARRDSNFIYRFLNRKWGQEP